MDEQVNKALKQLNFRWLPKHLNHIAENIVFKKRNISFLAINALFRQKNKHIGPSKSHFKNSYVVSGFVPIQKNDNLRKVPDILIVAFYLDNHNNIIVTTAYSENDD
ncbi:MAG: hypothetical protein AAF960_08130 [Bacteroidota bacterium]